MYHAPHLPVKGIFASPLYCLRLRCWTRLECFVRCAWSMSYMQRPVWVFLISVCHSIQFFMWICVGAAFWNKSCTGFHSCHPWLKVFADALKQLSLLLPSLLNAQWWHSAVIKKRFRVLIWHSRRSMPLWFLPFQSLQKYHDVTCEHEIRPKNTHNVGRYHPKKIMRGRSFCPSAKHWSLCAYRGRQDSAVVHETPEVQHLAAK